MGYERDPFASPPRAFISYARSDGTDLATSLRARLERVHPEITLWLDRAQMVGGIGWWKQITEALDQVEILVMVMTPAAMESEVAADEWRYARQQGVRVCPVMKGGSQLDFDKIPNWMRKAHFYNLDLEWDTFVGFLRSTGKDNRVPFMAPDLPDIYVERPEHFEAIISCLLDESRENPCPVTAALQGVGGFGKTTLACIICHDGNIISAFDDGILWTTLGEKPDIRGELTKLYATLTGERPPFIDVDDASIQLAERLEHKNCLLVIDDVWNPNHLTPFLRGGLQSARLITTRHLRVVTEINGARTVVDKMSEEQGVTLLTSRIPSAPQHLDKLKALADRLGGWPLLLKLAGSQLRERMERGDSLDRTISYLNRAMDRRGVVAFDRTSSTARNDAITSTVGASLELFSSQDQERCAELAVFRPDVPFSIAAVSVLWGLEEFDTEYLLLRFDDAALLDFDLKTGGIYIHRVLRAYLESQLDNINDLHTRLVVRWLQNPYNFPDAYACMWIGWHLAQSGESERLRELLLDYHWLKSRLEKIPVQALLQDFDLLEDEQDTRVVRDALRLASQGLSFDPKQLRIQLEGRIDRGHSIIIDALLDNADASEPKPRLTLAGTSLTHPGGALTGIVKSHGGPVEALAVSPDGRWFVSGSQDWALRLWDLQSGSVVRTFKGHVGVVHAVAFTSDGKSILSGSEDRTVRLWDVDSGKEIQSLKGHTLAVQGVAISADSKFACSVSEDGTVRLWEIASRVSKVVYKGRDHQLNTVTITANGGTLYFGAGDWTIRQLDLKCGVETTFEGHSGIVRSLALTSDGNRLLSSADDGTIRVWSLDTCDLLRVLTGHAGSVDVIAVTPDGKVCISGSRDKTLRVWDLETGAEREVLEGHSGFVKAVAISSSTGQVLSGSTDKTIRYWNIEATPHDQYGSGHNGGVALLTLSADGRRAISGTQAGELILWESRVPENPDENDAIDECKAPSQVVGCLDGHTDRIYSLQMTADGERAVTGSRDRTLRVWDIGQRACTQVLRGHSREVLYMDTSADGRRIVSLSRDRTLRVWDAETGRSIRALVSADDKRALSGLRVDDAMLAELDAGPEVDKSNKPITRDSRIALSPDGSHVVLGSQGNVSVWDLNRGSTRDQGLGYLDIAVIAFDMESTRSVLGSLFGPMLVWDFGEEPTRFEGHRGRVMDIVVMPGGKTMISGGKDDTIRIWDIDLCTQKAQITGPFGKADAIVIAPDGHFAYSIYGDTLIAYDLDKTVRIASISVDHQISAIAVTPAGTRVVIGDQSGQVHHLCLN